jgi:hypothetical protein
LYEKAKEGVDNDSVCYLSIRARRMSADDDAYLFDPCFLVQLHHPGVRPLKGPYLVLVIE